MTIQTLKREKKIISEFNFFYNDNILEIPEWQKKELNKTDKRVEEEFKKNGFIKTYSVEEVDTRIKKYISNLYSNKK